MAGKRPESVSTGGVCRGAALALVFVALSAGVGTAGTKDNTVTVRVLPQPLATSGLPLSIGIGLGLAQGEEGHPLLSEAEEGLAWDPRAVEALRWVAPGALRWPVLDDGAFYNWYEGVGPRASRKGLGTLEAVALARQVGAEPVLRVTVFEPRMATERVPDAAAALQVAADWVAYCNATGGHPMALLRTWHGVPEALRVTRWEVAAAGGGAPDAAAVQTYAAAMRAENAGIVVCAAPGRVDVARADRYVYDVRRRLAAGDAAERRYFDRWYAALELASCAVRMIGSGGRLRTDCDPAQVVKLAGLKSKARYVPTEQGEMMALFNRFPAFVPLEAVCGGKSAAAVRVQAAWVEEGTAVTVFVYNPEPEARTVFLDMGAMRRRFVFWVMDQTAADITARRVTPSVPLKRVQKAGSALRQTVTVEVLPSSVTRVLVKE